MAKVLIAGAFPLSSPFGRRNTHKCFLFCSVPKFSFMHGLSSLKVRDVSVRTS